MKRHQQYQLFGQLRSEEYAALEQDISKRGVMVPVEVDEKGVILDGHHRVEIADRLGKPYKKIVRRFKTEGEKREHVIMLNLARRHLDDIRWAKGLEMLAAEVGVAIGTKGGRPKKGKNPDTLSGLFKKVGVSQRMGERRMAKLKTYRALPAKERAAVDTKEKTVTQAKRDVKEKTREKKRAKDQEKVSRSKNLDKIRGVFATIMMDPPWDWGDEKDVDQLGRARPTYQTIPFPKLLALPVGEKAADDCHLYLWITNRSLPKGFELLDRWGFRYVTCLTWCKPSIGMGNYFRGKTEHLLFGVKGSLPLKRKDVGTWFAAPRGKGGHSSKPVEVYDLIESCSPGPYLEGFARSKRKGWVAWGCK